MRSRKNDFGRTLVLSSDKTHVVGIPWSRSNLDLESRIARIVVVVGTPRTVLHPLDRRIAAQDEVRPTLGTGALDPPHLATSHHGSSRIDSLADHSAHSSSSAVGGTRVYPSTISRSIRSDSSWATRRSMASTMRLALRRMRAGGDEVVDAHQPCRLTYEQ